MTAFPEGVAVPASSTCYCSRDSVFRAVGKGDVGTSLCRYQCSEPVRSFQVWKPKVSPETTARSCDTCHLRLRIGSGRTPMRGLIAEAANLIVSIVKTDASRGRRTDEVVKIMGFANGNYCFSEPE